LQEDQAGNQNYYELAYHIIANSDKRLPVMKHPGRLLIYWDYELQRGADVSPSGRHDWGIEDFRQTEKLLELLDQYQVKTTFAVVGFAALDGELPYHAPAQIREIARRGHEVASHTWMHDWVPGLT
jgi:hypothetical protein